MNRLFFLLLCATLGLFLTSSCVEDNPDLTTQIVGIYEGTLTLNLDTDSIRDIPQQRIEISRLDDTYVQIVPLQYSADSPTNGVTLNALLTPTPYGFIQSTGVMLTIEQASHDRGVIEGVPFSVDITGNEHGKFDQEKGEILFTLETVIDGVAHYELFEGKKQ